MNLRQVIENVFIQVKYASDKILKTILRHDYSAPIIVNHDFNYISSSSMAISRDYNYRVKI